MAQTIDGSSFQGGGKTSWWKHSFERMAGADTAGPKSIFNSI
jgi:hypothetical protein